MYNLVEAVEISDYGSHSSWICRTAQGSPVYIRYTAGELKIWVGPVRGTISDTLCSTPVYTYTYTGDEDIDKCDGDNWITWDEVKRLTGITCFDSNYYEYGAL